MEVLFLFAGILFLIMEYPMIILTIVLGFVALIVIGVIIASKFPNFAKKHKTNTTMSNFEEDDEPLIFEVPKKHNGRCNGNCANCPPHYGYRYGRWYYGHDHVEGCEFGGNRCSGSRD